METVAEVRYINGQRHHFQLKEQGQITNAPHPLSDGDTCIISGGTGGLGLLLARHLVSKAKLNLVLAARSEPSEKLLGVVKELEQTGSQVALIRADITRREDAQQLVEQTRQRFGRIDAVVHAAGLTRDSFLRNKTLKEVDQVLAPKLSGTMYLDEATAQDKLKFFALFSALGALKGNPGQCDYSYANRFMDLFAERRETQRKQNQRHGTTIAYNWPLWRNGGMQVDAQYEKLLATTWGMHPLDTQPGLDTFDAALHTGLSQLVVLQGDRAKILRVFCTPDLAAPKSEPAATATNTDVNITDALITDLKKGVYEVLQVDASQADPEADMSEWGFDSVTFTEYTNFINDHFDMEVTPIIFFEVQTLSELSEYLIEEHGSELNTFFQGKTPSAKSAPAPAPEPTAMPAASPVINMVGVVTWPTRDKGERFM